MYAFHNTHTLQERHQRKQRQHIKYQNAARVCTQVFVCAKPKSLTRSISRTCSTDQNKCKFSGDRTDDQTAVHEGNNHTNCFGRGQESLRESGIGETQTFETCVMQDVRRRPLGLPNQLDEQPQPGAVHSGKLGSGAKTFADAAQRLAFCSLGKPAALHRRLALCSPVPMKNDGLKVARVRSAFDSL